MKWSDWPAACFVVTAGLALAFPASAQTAASEERLRLLMQGRQSAANAKQPLSDRSLERMALLEQGETALARMDVVAAERAFDRAAMIAHAADSEMGLVRTYMQAGQYRRALAFGAHTAGAHLDAVGGAALYAWLLHAGGQEALAQRLLAEAALQAPEQPLVAQAAAALRAAAPVASGTLLALPARLAPYASPEAASPNNRVVSSATLVGDGSYAVVPSSSLSSGRRVRYWVRNGMGQTVRAVIQCRCQSTEVALLRLNSGLPVASTSLSVANAFPGSVVMTVGYAAHADYNAAWPILRTGFAGQPTDEAGGRDMSAVAVAIRPGGPVFNQAGHLVGVVAGPANKHRLVAASQLKKLLHAAGLPPVVQEGQSSISRMQQDLIYENALRTALQLIASH